MRREHKIFTDRHYIPSKQSAHRAWSEQELIGEQTAIVRFDVRELHGSDNCRF